MQPDDLTETDLLTDDSVEDESTAQCRLTGQPIKENGKEKNLQALILMLLEEYGFDKEDMARD